MPDVLLCPIFDLSESFLGDCTTHSIGGEPTLRSPEEALDGYFGYSTGCH
jgi:hypothetical protein